MDNPKVTTGPAAPAYDLTAIKAHCRVGHTDDDTLLTALCDAAERYIEEYIGRALINQTLTWYLNGFGQNPRDPLSSFWYSASPYGDKNPAVLNFPVLPVTAITSFSYIDTSGNSQNLTGGDYELDLINGRVMPSASLSVWPQVSSEVFNPVTIVFTAGYGADNTAVPYKIKQALAMLVAFWYDNRENATFAAMQHTPDGFAELLAEYKKQVF